MSSAKPLPRRAALLLTAALATLAAHAPAAAAEDLGCLTEAKGKVLIWDKRWDSGSKDEGVPYRILEVSVRYRYPTRAQSVALVLSAAAPAAKPYRKLRVEEEADTAGVCSRLAARAPAPAPASPLPEEPPGGHSDKDARLLAEDLPFITMTEDGWVRADRPAEAAGLGICRVLMKAFLCRRQERSAYLRELAELEEDLVFSPLHQ